MGCLRQVFVRVASTLIIVVLLILAVMYHQPIIEYIDTWRGHPKREFTSATRPDNAHHKDPMAELKRLDQPGGPAYVDLTAADLARLVELSFAGLPQRPFDSVQVALSENSVTIRGMLDLRRVPRNLLGPFASALNDHEPALIGGPLAAGSPKGLVLTVKQLEVKSFPFPQSTIPRIIETLHIPGASGADLPLPLDVHFGDVRVTPQYARFYRSSAR